MTRLSRKRLPVGLGDVVAGLLIALLVCGWYVVGRSGLDVPKPTASRGLQSALAADAGRTPTAAPSLSAIPGATPGLSPTPSPSAVLPPSAGPTPGPAQSRPPAPSNTAAPTATPAGKSMPTAAALPDLLAVDYGVGDGQLTCGSEDTSYVAVQNAGKAAAPKGIAVLFQLLENGKPTWTETQTIPVEIAPGESYTLKAVFRPAEPCPVELSRTWSFSIDPANAVLESKEDNNSAAISWKSATG